MISTATIYPSRPRWIPCAPPAASPLNSPRALPPVHRTVPRLTLPSPSNPQGLSYTTFNIVPVGISGDDSASTSQALQTIDTQSELLRGSSGSDAGPPPTTYSVKVTNTGSVAGDEVVLAYLTKGCSDLPPPPDANASSQLFGFERVTLDAGASTVVTFNVTLRAVSYVSTARHRCSDHKRSQQSAAHHLAGASGLQLAVPCAMYQVTTSSFFFL